MSRPRQIDGELQKAYFKPLQPILVSVQLDQTISPDDQSETENVVSASVSIDPDPDSELMLGTCEFFAGEREKSSDDVSDAKFRLK